MRRESIEHAPQQRRHRIADDVGDDGADALGHRRIGDGHLDDLTMDGVSLCHGCSTEVPRAV